MTGIFSQRAWEKVWLYREGFLLGLWTTIKTAFFGLLLALALGILFGLMSTSGKKPLRMIGRVYVEFIQNTPVLLQLCFLYYALAFSDHGIGILATGSIALGIYHGAYMSEVVRAGIEAIPKGQSEAAQSQGFGYMERMYYIILPQSIRTCIHNRMMQAGQGIFPPCKAKNRSNTWCIARFFPGAKSRLRRLRLDAPAGAVTRQGGKRPGLTASDGCEYRFSRSSCRRWSTKW